MNQVSLTDYRRQIEHHIEHGRFEGAIAHGVNVLRQHPEYIEGYWLLGKAMLEANHGVFAVGMFQRVLIADPEHVGAWVGMSRAVRTRGELEEAAWYLQRAFELAADNNTVAQELRDLRRELDRSESERLQLSEAGLARLHLRGDLLNRAIAALRGLVEEHPDRLDLKATLVEALWRNGQRLQASQVSQEILEEQPYNLKANLILGRIWSGGGRTAEGEPYLERAEALDPENEMAQKLFESASLLPREQPYVVPLANEVEPGEEQMEWIVELEEAGPALAEEVMMAEFRIPAWLRRLTGEPSAGAAAKKEKPSPETEGESISPEEQLPEESSDERVAAEETAPEKMPDGDFLSWLSKLDQEEPAPSSGEETVEERLPGWLTEVEISAEDIYLEDEEAPDEAEPETPEIPDWLQGLAPSGAEAPATVSADAPQAVPEEHLSGEPEKLEAVTSHSQVPEPEVPEGDVPESGTSQAEEAAIEELRTVQGLSDWVVAEDLPSGEDALAWLAQLAKGEDEEPHAHAQARTADEGESPPPESVGEADAPTEKETDMASPEPATRHEVEELSPIEKIKALQAPGAPTVEEVTPPIEALSPTPARDALAAEGKAMETEAEPEPLTPDELPLEGGVSLAEALERAPAEDLEGFIDVQLEYAEEHPDDQEAQLELGRILWQADRREDAVKVYENLIGRSKLLDEVVADLEHYARQWPDARVMQALGDAYRETDRLEDALDTYRQALARL